MIERRTTSEAPAADTVGTHPSVTLAAGRYSLGEQLGAGGMGLVRRATDHVLQRDVAVKLLADNLAADPDARERFVREARAAARIIDPHVVTVYDVGDEDGRPYIVMELVDGPSLADALRRSGPLEPGQVADVAAHALAGLDRAHAAGLLHRDVKPGNLLLAPNGVVKVTDFGVAEAADAPGLTRTGLVIGTRPYLAPERLQGAPASRATDLYALGVTCVELLTGHPAGTPPKPLPSGTPAGLRRLLPSLLAPDADDRPVSAEEALVALDGGRSAGPPAATASVASGAAQTVRSGSTTTRPLVPDRPASASPGGRRGRVWPTLGTVAGGAVLVAALLALDDVGATTETEGVQGEGVERHEEDPAQTARNLAEWLRDQAG